MIEEILKKESLDEADLKVLAANSHLLSQKDLVRLGFIEAKTEEEAPKVEAEEKPTKKITK